MTGAAFASLIQSHVEAGQPPNAVITYDSAADHTPGTTPVVVDSVHMVQGTLVLTVRQATAQMYGAIGLLPFAASDVHLANVNVFFDGYCMPPPSERSSTSGDGEPGGGLCAGGRLRI